MQPHTTGEVVLLIPALEPDRHLLELLEQMRTCWDGPILLVDDGSRTELAKNEIFPQAQAMGCVVIRHAVNLGKGRALKTGFNECLLRWPELVGVVTADADGQHLPQDILACAQRLREQPSALVLGCRNFSEDGVPTHNALGNRITRTFMKLLCGVGVTDTQTGLRAIPRSFMIPLMEVSGERFEFETNMLLETRTQEVPITEVPISTVYIEQGRQSHFHVFRDSIRIYSQLLRFSLSSIIGFLVDISLFDLFSRLLSAGLGEWSIAAATALARIISASVNFLINRRVVFRSEKAASGSAGRYALLCAVQMVASAALVTLAASLIPAAPVTLLKVIVDVILFFFSFQIQRRWVF